ncbi:hypothetical protein [Nostoc sp. ChiQUE01b]|uniref:hypothetical protein n=1 Tax=Nostoc sp. ChiQUE01b TaxID=3075376 RepID=UPI002AD51601|nr:hypothetical protein [Nostoc sp. ChiQUE01b]MDZ8264143.1 hypothetical protein [Nostoc sp. ChiQUE01b]
MTTATATKRKKHPDKAQLDYFLSQLRQAIKKDIAEFKASKKTSEGYWISDYSKYRIKDKNKVTVDHVYPLSFRRLAHDWIKSREIDLNAIDSLTHLELKILLADWVEFHRANCKLQIVSKSQNKYLWLVNKSQDIHYSKFYQNSANIS